MNLIQSSDQYIQSLQLEYICYEIRSIIYPSQKDKAYFQKIMQFKKEKIDTFSNKKPVPTIFNSLRERDRLYRLVLPASGFPNFDQISYKNTEILLEFQEKDFKFYYKIGADFQVEQEDRSFKLGVLENINRKKKIATVRYKGDSSSSVVSIDHLSRVIFQHIQYDNER
jgi:hypothetical protein